MADNFFSRIFAIPSDVSSNNSAQDLTAFHGPNNASGGARKKTSIQKDHFDTDGNGMTSVSFGEGTLSYASDSTSDGSVSSTSSDTEMVEEYLHCAERREAPATTTGRHHYSHRGRQSMEPSCRHDGNMRSSSMAATSRNMQLQLNSPTKNVGRSRRRPRSLSKMGAKRANDARQMQNMTVHSWSSGEGRLETRARKDCRRPRRSHSAKKKDKRDGGGGWRLKLAGGMMKLSPGTAPIAVSGGPPVSKAKGRKKKQRRSCSAVTPAANQVVSAQNQCETALLHGEGLKKKHGLLGTNAGGLNPNLHLSPRPQRPPRIVLSQQSLEGPEMSVLTLPNELVAMNEGATLTESGFRGGSGGLTDFERNSLAVGQCSVMENNERVQAFLARQVLAKRGSDASGYANRTAEGSARQSCIKGSLPDTLDQQGSIVHDNSEDGIEVRPAMDTVGKHAWPCDPSADGYSPETVRHAPLAGPTPLVSGHALPPRWHDGERNALEDSWGVDSVATSKVDPPGTLLTSPTLVMAPIRETLAGHAAAVPSSGENDPRQSRPFDEASSYGGHCEQWRGVTPNRSPRSKDRAAIFSLPPPPMLASFHSTAPPRMGPPLNYYYAMERVKTDNADNWMPSSSFTMLIPPLVELWSSVEGSDSVLDCDIIGFVGGGGWDIKTERELLGEDIGVWEQLIDLHNRSARTRTGGLSKGNPSHNSQAQAPTIDAHTDPCPHQKSRSSLTVKRVNTAIVSSWDNSAPHDEYYNDTLYCGEMFGKMNVNNHKATAAQLSSNRSAVALDSTLSNGMDDTNDGNLDEDLNRCLLRYRSAWKHRFYKPPKLCLSDREDSSGNISGYSSLMSSPSSSAENWQRLVRHRTMAAVAIQKSVRGLLERKHLRMLLASVLILQPFIRQFLIRKKFFNYLKVKRSYYPEKWKRSNMSVVV